MPSFDAVNYHIRANKAIQRSLAFDGISKLITLCEMKNPIYIGLGSIWFSDFLSAHKQLGINRLISIECDEIGYKRAKFNKPFNCIEVRHGLANDELTALSKSKASSVDPWVLWLDYDYEINESTINDLADIPEIAPKNSIALFTVNAVASRYGRNAGERADRLRGLFGDVFPNDMDRARLSSKNFHNTLGEVCNNYLSSRTIAIGRPGAFIPLWLMPYRDGPWMLTFGGMFCSSGAAPAVRQLQGTKEWFGFVSQEVATPPLTLRESVALQSLLPRSRKLSRRMVQRLGFDLDEKQIRSFEVFYRYYPHFAQIAD